MKPITMSYESELAYEDLCRMNKDSKEYTLAVKDFESNYGDINLYADYHELTTYEMDYVHTLIASEELEAKRARYTECLARFEAKWGALDINIDAA